jgi:hypothetical protein
MTPLEARNAKLDEAKALILKGWCQNVYARDSFGNEIDAKSPDATCFCVIGAIIHICEKPLYRIVSNALYAVKNDVLLMDGLTPYNDAPGRTKYEVAALFDHAKEMPL